VFSSWPAVRSRRCPQWPARALHPRGRHDFLDTLVALGFLTRSDERLREHRPRRISSSTRAKPFVMWAESRDGQPIAFIPSGATHRALRTGLAAEQLKGGGEVCFEGRFMGSRPPAGISSPR